MGKQAFALREDQKDSFSDAAVTVRGGSSLRVAERLKQGGGVIVTDDPREQEALKSVAALKEVPVSEARAKSPKTVTQLRETLDARGVDHSEAKTKDELQKLVEDSNQAGSAGGGE